MARRALSWRARRRQSWRTSPGRVAEAPDGLIRSFQADGTLREQTFAEIWRRSAEIAARLRGLGVGPRSQTVLLLGDLLDFVSSFWASLRVGATAIPFSGVAHTATAEDLKSLAARLERPALIADTSTPDLGRLTALLPDAPVLRLSSLSGDGDEAEKTWIPATSLTSSVSSRPRARPEA